MMNDPAVPDKTRLLTIGLTGLYCAGKNCVAALLEKRGVPVLDVDKLGHAAIEREKAAIAGRFGETALAADGSVDRRLLAEKVFGRAEELAALEAIVHPAANALAEAWLVRQAAAPSPDAVPRLCAVNAALLHRASVFSRLDAIIIVQAPFLARFFRAGKRDGLSPEAILRRFSCQKKFYPQYLKTNADIYTIDNPGLSGPGPAAKRRLEKRLNEILAAVRDRR